MLKADFEAVLADIKAKFILAPSVPVNSWQSIKAPQPMPEILNYSFQLKLDGFTLQTYQDAIKPNLPWADEHFKLERSSGKPINPGTTWRSWPYAHSANKHRRPGEEDPKFDHTYAERYWPKNAELPKGETHKGIRFPYGDLSDLVSLLGKDPLTRQAYLPIWFPEDLSAANESKRVPCSLGYHFINRDNKFHCVYPIRSCDFVRHFQDDVYLTIRLQLWILQLLHYNNPDTWKQVHPGTFTMHITSLHLFEQDRNNLIKEFK